MEISLSERITQLREQRGWEKQELAARAGVHPSTIGMIEKAQRTDPSISTVQAIARAFNMTVGQFLMEEPAIENELEPFRAVADAAREYNLGPRDLVQLIRTLAVMFTKQEKASSV